MQGKTVNNPSLPDLCSNSDAACLLYDAIGGIILNDDSSAEIKMD